MTMENFIIPPPFSENDPLLNLKKKCLDFRGEKMLSEKEILSYYSTRKDYTRQIVMS
jgi:hypothetical protein